MHLFLEAYGATGSLTHAAEIAGIGRRTHYNWLERPAYARAFEMYQRLAGEYMESLAVERAAKGWLEPVYYQGEQCGSVRRYDSGLIQFLLRGMMPEKYGSKTEITGPAGTPLQAEVVVRFVRPGDGNQE